MSQAVTNFMKQQGFVDEPFDACNMHFEALYFQPRLVFPWVLAAIVLQSVPLFLVLGAVLTWNVVFPAYNPFELAYNRFVAPHDREPPLAPAPAPRRFAQGMAAAFLLGSAVCVANGWQAAAWTLQAFVVIAFVALLFGRFCLGAYVYHVLRGEFTFANRTLPWGRG
jgi:hypothetical protein